MHHALNINYFDFLNCSSCNLSFIKMFFFFQTKNDPLKLFDSVVRVHNAVVRDVVCLDVRNVAERHDVISDGDAHEAMLLLEHHQLVSVSVQIAAKNASTCALLNQLFLCVHSFMQVYTHISLIRMYSYRRLPPPPFTSKSYAPSDDVTLSCCFMCCMLWS